MREHVALSTSCVDRLYINGYLPTLQTPGQLCTFLHDHLGYPIPSPALLRPLHDRFVQAVSAFAQQQGVPVVRFERGQRKDDVAARYRSHSSVSDGVVFIGVAQERAFSFKAHKSIGAHGGVHFTFARQPVYVNHFYFYLHDLEWGPAFIKIGTYVPYPVRVCLNGHEWAKQQLQRAGIPFGSLDNGLRWCAEPERLQAICDQLAPNDVQAFFERWLARLPWPLSTADRIAGYRHRLSIWQMEVSLTQVFTEPIWGRRFFETVIRTNLDLGRPDRVSLLFPTRLTRRTPAPASGYRTRVIVAGVAPSLHVAYKHSHLKQYFKEGCALRTETTINNPLDFQSTKALATLANLRAIGQRVNQRLLEVEQIVDSQGIDSASFDQLQQPVWTTSGQRIAALRFGDPRVHGLFEAICHFSHVPNGFRHRALRPLVAGLLGREFANYPAGAMTYDLRRLRWHGLIVRLPGTLRYLPTTAGLRLAAAYTAVRHHLQNFTTTSPDLPPPLGPAIRHLAMALQKLRPTPTH
jgi:hypothetical protein